MIRQPTPVMRLLRWHRQFMRGESPDRHDADPQCGWYRMRRVKDGPWIPVEIWCDAQTDEHGELTGDEVFRADAFGDEVDAQDIWTWLKPISKKDFAELTDFRMKNQHIIQNNMPIDLGRSPTPPKG